MKRIMFILCILIVFFPTAVYADLEGAVGSVKKVKGKASVVRDGRVIPAEIGLRLMEKDALRTGSDGSIGVIFEDNTVLSLGPNSHLKIDEYVYAPNMHKYSMVVKLFKGTVSYLSGLIARLSPGATRFETPTASLGIRGTHFLAKVGG